MLLRHFLRLLRHGFADECFAQLFEGDGQLRHWLNLRVPGLEGPGYRREAAGYSGFGSRPRRRAIAAAGEMEPSRIAFI